MTWCVKRTRLPRESRG